jgi:hypothetical protein
VNDAYLRSLLLSGPKAPSSFTLFSLDNCNM